MKLEIVSHCWRYSRLLTYQLSSLMLYPPQRVSVTMTVFLSEEDRGTVETVQFFSELAQPAGVDLRPWYLPRDKLLQRAIGRNLAALATDADWVWFADCDLLFRQGALDALSEVSESADVPLVFPRYLFNSQTRELGDMAIGRLAKPPQLVDIDPEDFAKSRITRAIGALQIARGDVVRKSGYLKRDPIQRRSPKRWQRTYEDISFRRSVGGKSLAIDVPNVYRIRHSRAGRHVEDLEL